MKTNYSEKIKTISNEAHAIIEAIVKGMAHRDVAFRAIYYLESEDDAKSLRKAEKIVGFLRRKEFEAAEKYVRTQNARGNLYLD